MAAAHFSVVQFVPDFVANERVNVAVLVFPESGQPLVQPVRSWNRVKRFAGRDITRVQEFIHALCEGSGAGLSLEQARVAAKGWHHAVQFTDPQPSTLAPEELLKSIAPKFLRDEAPVAVDQAPAKPPRTKSHAVRFAYQTLRRAMGNQKKVIKTKLPHSGKKGQHRFDLGGLNGRLYFLAQAVSFEQPDEEKTSKEVDAASWRFEDVRSADPMLTLAAFALVPQGSNVEPPLLAQAKKNFKDINVQLVTEGDLPNWAERMASRIRSRTLWE